MNQCTKVMFGLSVICLLSCCTKNYAFGNNPQGNSTPVKMFNNPIIPAMGVCDPHVHIFNNKAYLFATHDEKPGNKFYAMYDWWVWSSSDLVNWELDFTLSPKNMWVGPTKNCWAVDAAERDGKYYFYVSGNWRTGVAMSSAGPAGPYKDALGKALYTDYDPTVFIDDDPNKTPYLITSGFPYKIGKLNNDMISLAEVPREITHTSDAWKGDGGFLHKRNGIYYLNGHGCNYSTATNIYGPYTYRGKFHQQWIDHATIFNWNNQTFCAFGVSDGDPFYRKTCMTYIYYRNNGDIVADEKVSKSFIGVGQYDCSNKIEAEWYFASSDGTNKHEINSGFAVGNLKNRAYLYYPRILNVADDAAMSISISSTGQGGILEIRQDKINGPLLGKIAIPNTGSLGNYETISTKLKSKAGLNNIYLVMTGSESAVSIDWFTISSSGAIPPPPKVIPEIKKCNELETALPVGAYKQIEAEDFACFSSLQIGACNKEEGGKKLSFIEDLSHCSYKIDFGPKVNESINFQARVASGSAAGGKIEIRLNAIDGQLLGICEIPSTGGWQTWLTKECMIKAPVGINNIYLLFKGGEGYLFDVNWFKFMNNAH